MISVKSDEAVSGNSSLKPSLPAQRRDGFLLAHLSDPHLSCLKDVPFRDLLNKRILGYLSWLKDRRHIHRPEILAELIADLRSQKVDHTVVTGDLTHLGLPLEFRQVLSWLENFGDSRDVTVIPGNHDAYWPTARENTLDTWKPYMESDPSWDCGNLFPSVRIRKDVALIGLSSARPSAPFLAVGSLGTQQMERFEKVLARTGREGLLRVVLLHHPPVRASINWRKRLTDSGEFSRILGRAGASLVLHGHAHRPFQGELRGPEGPIPVIGVPSASEITRNPPRGSQYHLYRFLRETGRWEVNVSVRAFDPLNGGFFQKREFRLVLPEESRKARETRN